MPTSQYNQEIGPSLPSFAPCSLPPKGILQGHYIALEPLDPCTHNEDLFAAFSLPQDDRDWTYLFFERPTSLEGCMAFLTKLDTDPTIRIMVIRDKGTGVCVGMLSWMRMKPHVGVLEIGHVIFSPLLQRSRGGTEAVYLMVKWAFDTGYRRVEWKCDSLNDRSKRAALRYGFQFEGIFRQAVVYKGRNRDTAWYALLDSEWGAGGVESGFAKWLDPSNFDAKGAQRVPISSFMGLNRG
jgi:RimJ/RimL family protein N-acetyltransferase